MFVAAFHSVHNPHSTTLKELTCLVSGCRPKISQLDRGSQYRLMAHLGSAFLLYAGMFSLAMKHLIPITEGFAIPRRLKGMATGVAHMVFLTALSGFLQPYVSVHLKDRLLRDSMQVLSTTPGQRWVITGVLVACTCNPTLQGPA
jgi:hypothetical protein